MFKRLLALLLALVTLLSMAFTLTGCGEDEYDSPEETEGPEDTESTKPEDPADPPEEEVKNLLDRDSYSCDFADLSDEDWNRVVDALGVESLTNRVLNLYYQDGVNDFLNQFAAYGQYADMYLQMIGFYRSTPLDQQIFDEKTGKTWEHYFLENALNTWQRTQILCARGEAAGYVMPGEDAEKLYALESDLQNFAIYYGFTSIDAYLQKVYGITCDFQTYYAYQWDLRYSQLYFQHYTENLSVTDAEKDAYYQTNKESLISMYGTRGVTVDARHILIMPVDNDWDAALVKTQALLSTYRNGEMTEEAFAALATAYTEDPGSKETGGLYEDMFLGQMVEPFEAWCFDEARKYGDVDIVQTDYGYHIMFFVRTEEAVGNACLQGAQADKAQKDLEQWLTDAPMEVRYGAIALIAPTLV